MHPVRRLMDGVAQAACCDAEALVSQNQPLEALACFDRALDAVANYEPAIRGISAIAERLKLSKYSRELDRVLGRCLLSPAGNPDALAPAVGRLLELKYQISSDTIWSAEASISMSGLERLRNDVLLFGYLASTINQNVTLEAFLILARDALCRIYAAQGTLRGWHDFAGAIAAQAHNNEYVWPQTSEDRAWLTALEADLQNRALDTKDDHIIDLFLAYAMFSDPYALAFWRWTFTQSPLQDYPPAFQSVVQRTIRDPAQQAELARSIPRRTPIAEVSQEVRVMYEVNAYPRWLHLSRPSARIDPGAMLKNRFPHLRALPGSAGPMQILMPGVGTGRHALWAATRYENVEITAVDLSLRSLAYARHMAERSEVTNVTFEQGDILTLQGQYDWIECTGVLHHLKRPEEGFRRLASCLKPGGVMQVMVYSKAHRAEIYRLRSRVGEIRRDWTTDEIRTLRARIVRPHGDLAEFVDLTRRPDFHSVSGFRDLILHVEEHPFTMARVRAMIEASDLKFVGFEFTTGRVMQMFAESEAQRRYRKTFPEETTLSDLAIWETLEDKNPQLFSNYFFWCQKPA